MGGAKELGIVYINIIGGTKEPRNLQNHRGVGLMKNGKENGNYNIIRGSVLGFYLNPKPETCIIRGSILGFYGGVV